MHFLKFSIPTLKTNFTRSELKNFLLKSILFTIKLWVNKIWQINWLPDQTWFLSETKQAHHRQTMCGESNKGHTGARCTTLQKDFKNSNHLHPLLYTEIRQKNVPIYAYNQLPKFFSLCQAASWKQTNTAPALTI